MFLRRNKKNNIYLCEPQFLLCKSGDIVVKTITACVRDDYAFHYTKPLRIILLSSRYVLNNVERAVKTYKQITNIIRVKVLLKGNGYTFKGDRFLNCYASLLLRSLL